jgi:hypothetical protein
MTRLVRTLAFTALLAASTLAACSDDEAPAAGHGSPETVQLYDVTSGAMLAAPYELPAGTTTRIEVRYYDADGDLLNPEIESDHYTSLTFAPGTFATVAEVAGVRFQRDVTVTASAGATATIAVGYGHDAAADEATFGPFDVTAAAAVALRR